MNAASISARGLSANLWQSSFCASRAVSPTLFHCPTISIHTSSPGPRSWIRCRTFFTTQYRHISNQHGATKVNAVQNRQALISKSAYRQRDNQAGNQGRVSTSPSSKSPNRHPSNPEPSDSIKCSNRAVTAVKVRTNRAKELTRILHEKVIVLNTLKGGLVTGEERVEREAKFRALEFELQQYGPQCAWWRHIIKQWPTKELKEASDVYEHVRFAKAELKYDSEREQPVWTDEERRTIEMSLNEEEARMRKANRWYKKIAWGQSIIGYLILSLI
ncbi:MAG: hypothetical protein Q9224_003596 [Gallowayella concinna]